MNRETQALGNTNKRKSGSTAGRMQLSILDFVTPASGSEPRKTRRLSSSHQPFPSHSADTPGSTVQALNPEPPASCGLPAPGMPDSACHAANPADAPGGTVQPLNPSASSDVPVPAAYAPQAAGNASMARLQACEANACLPAGDSSAEGREALQMEGQVPGPASALLQAAEATTCNPVDNDTAAQEAAPAVASELPLASKPHATTADDRAARTTPISHSADEPSANDTIVAMDVDAAPGLAPPTESFHGTAMVDTHTSALQGMTLGETVPTASASNVQAKPVGVHPGCMLSALLSEVSAGIQLGPGSLPDAGAPNWTGPSAACHAAGNAHGARAAHEPRESPPQHNADIAAAAHSLAGASLSEMDGARTIASIAKTPADGAQASHSLDAQPGPSQAAIIPTTADRPADGAQASHSLEAQPGPLQAAIIPSIAERPADGAAATNALDGNAIPAQASPSRAAAIPPAIAAWLDGHRELVYNDKENQEAPVRLFTTRSPVISTRSPGHSSRSPGVASRLNGTVRGSPRLVTGSPSHPLRPCTGAGVLGQDIPSPARRSTAKRKLTALSPGPADLSAGIEDHQDADACTQGQSPMRQQQQHCGPAHALGSRDDVPSREHLLPAQGPTLQPQQQQHLRADAAASLDSAKAGGQGCSSSEAAAIPDRLGYLHPHAAKSDMIPKAEAPNDEAGMIPEAALTTVQPQQQQQQASRPGVCLPTQENTCLDCLPQPHTAGPACHDNGKQEQARQPTDKLENRRAFCLQAAENRQVQASAKILMGCCLCQC